MIGLGWIGSEGMVRDGMGSDLISIIGNGYGYGYEYK